VFLCNCAAVSPAAIALSITVESSKMSRKTNPLCYMRSFAAGTFCVCVCVCARVHASAHATQTCMEICLHACACTHLPQSTHLQMQRMQANGTQGGSQSLEASFQPAAHFRPVIDAVYEQLCSRSDCRCACRALTARTCACVTRSGTLRS